MKKLWKFLINLGVDSATGFQEAKDIRLINAYNIIAAPIALSYTLFLLFLGSPELALYDAVLFIMAIVFVFLCYIKQYRLTFVGMFSLYPIALLLISSVYGRVGTEYYLIPMLIFVSYIRKGKALMAIMTIFYLAFFLISKHFETTVKPQGLAYVLAPYFYYVNVISSFIVGLIFLRLIVIEYERNRVELRNKNELLENKVHEVEEKSKKIHILFKELNHRTKNNLQLVSSLINIQVKDVSDAHLKSILNDIQSRINSIALIHKSLYLSDRDSEIDVEKYVSELLKSLMDVCESDQKNINTVMAIEPIFINIDVAVTFGIILNELLSNAIEHGLKTTDLKQIRVVVKKKSKNWVNAVVYDSGSGISKLNEPSNFNFGMELVHDLVKQLKGSIKFYENEGNYVALDLEINEES